MVARLVVDVGPRMHGVPGLERRALETLRGSADARMSANEIMALTRIEGRRGS